MPDNLEGFAEWRDNIESRVGRLEDAVETEARARASMDEDLSAMSVKLDAQGSLLQALADTQSEHTAILAGHTAILADHTVRLTRLEVGMDRLEARTERLEVGMEKVLVGVQTIVGLLDGHDNLPGKAT